MDYAKAFFGGCVGVVEKGSVLPQSAAHVKGRPGWEESLLGPNTEKPVFPAATDSWAASRQGAEMGPVDPASGACFGGEFRILVGCRKQTLIG